MAAALAATALVSGIGFVIFGWLFPRTLLGRTNGTIALAWLAVPPASVMVITSIPVSYAETMMLLACMLWFVARTRQGKTGAGWLLAFGSVAGVAWRQSAQSLMILGPVLPWLKCTRPDALRGRAVAQAAAGLGYSARRIVSGAGHDAKYLAEICPTGMIFIPCEKGISHNEAENITPEDAAAGANVLLNSVLALANEA